MNTKRAANWQRARKWLFLLACAAMLVQIACGIIWTVANFDTIPSFGDSTEYYNLSETMSLDEYRPVLYPLLIRIARGIDEESYHHYMYVLQLGLSLFCMSYAVYTIDTLYAKGRRKITPRNLAKWLFGGLYLSMIPMIAFMNLTILTDSLANSLLVLMLALSMQFIYGRKLSIGKGVVLFIALVGQCLLRADRLYSGLLLLAILAIIAMVRSPGKRRKLLVGALCVGILTYGTFSIVSTATQVRGRNGRVQTSFSFILLDRVVWPRMAANYDYFPEEIRENIALEDAQLFDEQNNNVMYQLAPLLESRVGHEQAEAYYRVMAKIVWERQSSEVLHNIGDSLWRVLVTPLTHFQAVNGWFTRTAVGWNIRCLSNKTPEWTAHYDRIAFVVMVFMLCLGLLVSILDRVTRAFPAREFVLWPFVIAGLIICLWFTLGDGAPPNDRYMLIIHTTYWLWPLTAWYGKASKVNRKRHSYGRKDT